MCFLAKIYQIFHFWHVLARFFLIQGHKWFFQTFLHMNTCLLAAINLKKEQKLKKINLQKQGLKQYIKIQIEQWKSQPKMALDVLNPFFGSTFYSTYENSYLCKKLRKIDLLSWISKKLARNGSKREKLVKFRKKIVKNDL